MFGVVIDNLEEPASGWGLYSGTMEVISAFTLK
jgi:hypothetical protein